MSLPPPIKLIANRLPYIDKWQAYQSGIKRLAFLEKVIPKNGVGAEIGVFKGYFSPFLLDATVPKKLHLIDPWYLLGEEWGWASGSRSTSRALARIIRKNARDLASGKIVLNIGDDLEVLESFVDGYFDWVYLDTTHSYEQTVKELALLKSRVSRHGLITGDDWHSDPGHRHHGVCRAVREFAEREGYDLVYASDVDWQWALKPAA